MNSATERLQVLTLQLTAGQATTQRLDFCPKYMNDFITYDNKQLREVIFEFLKVRRHNSC